VASGVVGADVWGWFKVRVDPRAGTLHVLPLKSRAPPPALKGPNKSLLPEEPEPDDPDQSPQR
jgi:hypothetical protein